MVDKVSNASFIGAFDLSIEQFSKLAMPEYRVDNMNTRITFGSSDGCLCAVLNIRFDPSGITEEVGI